MIFEIELQCDYPQWWRYNLYLSLAGYDDSRRRVDFATFTDTVYDVTGREHAGPPPGWSADRGAAVRCTAPEYAEAFINVVTNTLPVTNRVGDCPDFGALLIGRCDGREILRRTIHVNCWGGFSLSGLELRPDKE